MKSCQYLKMSFPSWKDMVIVSFILYSPWSRHPSLSPFKSQGKISITHHNSQIKMWRRYSFKILWYVSWVRMPLLKHTWLGYPFDIKRFMWYEIHSRNHHLSPKNGDGWYHRFFNAVESNDKLEIHAPLKALIYCRNTADVTSNFKKNNIEANLTAPFALKKQHIVVENFWINRYLTYFVKCQ